MHLVYSENSQSFVDWRTWLTCGDAAAEQGGDGGECCVMDQLDVPEGLFQVVRGENVGYSPLPEQVLTSISEGGEEGLLPVLTAEGFDVWDEDGQSAWDYLFPGIKCSDVAEIHYAPACLGSLSYFRLKLKEGEAPIVEVVMGAGDTCLYRERSLVVTCEPRADRLVFKLPGLEGVAVTQRRIHRKLLFKIMRGEENTGQYMGVLTDVVLRWKPIPHFVFHFDTVWKRGGKKIDSADIPSHALYDWPSYSPELKGDWAESVNISTRERVIASGPPVKETAAEIKSAPQDSTEGTLATLIRTLISPLIESRAIPLNQAGKLPPMFTHALECAVEPEQRLELITFARELVERVKGSYDDATRQRTVNAILASDPGIFFSFCGRRLSEPERVEAIHASVFERATRAVRGRDELVARLCDFIARRQIGDAAARWPLLWGPPGTGKSYVAGLLANALTEAGIKTACVFQSMTMAMGQGHDDEIRMALTGSDSHWSNGDCGTLFSAARNNELVLAVLDEVDKYPNRGYLVGLLDPKLPLRDTFVKTVAPSHDIRHKVLFILTANDPSILRRGVDDPLWSRLSPLLVPAYSADEIEDIVAWQLSRDGVGPYRPEPAHVRRIVRGVLSGRGKMGLREVEDHVAERLFKERFGKMEISGSC
ncbi:AAA family ATPase [Geobacter anodireducens]